MDFVWFFYGAVALAAVVITRRIGRGEGLAIALAALVAVSFAANAIRGFPPEPTESFLQRSCVGSGPTQYCD